jgi:hypothetical protein
MTSNLSDAFTRSEPSIISPHESRAKDSKGLSDLKAQEDLLALKVLQDPGFLQRVPTLSSKTGKPHTEPSLSASLPHEMINESFSSLTPAQIEDTHLKLITQEVTQRVLQTLEEWVPDLIASTLEEVLMGTSQRKTEAPYPKP